MAEDPIEEIKRLNYKLKELRNHQGDAERLAEENKKLIGQLTKDKCFAESQLEGAREATQRAEAEAKASKEAAARTLKDYQQLEANLHDANAKLEHERKQVTKLNDDLAGTSRQSQAASAGEQELRNQLKTVEKECHELRENARQADQRQQEESKKRRESNHADEALTLDLQHCREELEKVTAKLATRERDLQNAHNQLAADKKAADAQVKTAEDQREELQYERDDLRQQLKDRELVEAEKLAETEKKVEAMGKELDNCFESLTNRDAELATAKAESMQIAAQLASLNESNEMLVARLANASNVVKELDEIRTAYETLESQLKVAHAHASSLEDERHAALEKQAETDAQVAAQAARVDEMQNAAVLATQQLQSAKDALLAAEEKHTKLHAQHLESEANHNSARQRVKSIERDLESMQLELSQTQSALESASQRADAASSAQSTAEAKAAKLATDLHTMAASSAEERNRATKAEAELDALRALPVRSFTDVEVNALQARHDELAQLHETLNAEVGQLRTMEEGLGRQLVEKGQELDELRASHAVEVQSLTTRHAEEVEKHTATAFAANSRAAELEEQLKERDVLKQTCQTYESRLVELQREMDETSNRRSSEAFHLANSQRTRDEALTRVSDLEEKFEGFKEATSKYKIEKEAELAGLREQADSVQSQLSHDLANAQASAQSAHERMEQLESRISDLVVERDGLQQRIQSASKAVEETSKLSKSESSEVESIAQAEQLVTRLRQERDAALVQKQHLDAEVVSLQGSYEQKKDKLLAANARIDELLEELKLVRSSLANAEALAGDSKREQERAVLELAVSKEATETIVAELQEKLDELTAQLKSAEDQAAQTRSRLAEVEAELSSVRADLAEMTKLRDDALADVQTQDKAIEDLEAERDQLKMATFNALQQIEHGRSETSRPPIPAELTASTAAQLWKKTSELEKERDEWKAKVGRRENQIRRMQGQIDQLNMAVALLTPLEPNDSIADATLADDASAPPEYTLKPPVPPISSRDVEQLEAALHGVILLLVQQRQSRSRASTRLTSTLDSLQTECDDLRASLQQAHLEITTLSAVSEAAQLENANIRSTAHATHVELQQVIDALREQVVELSGHIGAARHQCLELESEKQILVQGAEAHSERLRKEAAMLKDMVAAKDGELDNVRRELADICIEHNAVTAEWEQITGDKAELENAVIALERDLHQLQQHAEQLEFERQELAQSLSRAKDEAEEADDKLVEALKANKKLTAQAEKYKVRYETVNRDLSKRIEADSKGIKRANEFPDGQSPTLPARAVVQPAPVRPAGPSDSGEWKSSPPIATKPYNFVPVVEPSFKPKKQEAKPRAALASLGQGVPPPQASSLQARLTALKSTRM